MHKTGTKHLRIIFSSQGSGNKIGRVLKPIEIMEYSEGVERINREVSTWMTSSSNDEDSPEMPFISTRGYDSVVWSILYSRETSDQDDYQLNRQVKFKSPQS
ncbi:hypothetical protein F2Q68_00020861 [Brassica cretica]|uniref:Uncharacterized protein n=1 Tax=Brassica cretica TaxID=69181 RepID=A0A8S9FR67_BRACR|nr:hypothetical protein F2Q68_00020861 [Brassica cretica]